MTRRDSVAVCVRPMPAFARVRTSPSRRPGLRREFGAHGVRLRTPLLLPGRWRAACPEDRPVDLDLAEPAAVEAAWSGRARGGWEGVVDGRPFAVEHGTAGDVRMTLAGVAVFHLDPVAGRLIAATDDPSDPLFLRVLLDSVLFTVALVLGVEALHAGAVELGGEVIAVAGPTGAGKSSLVRALLAEGATFVADDVVALRARSGAILAHPAPPVMTVPIEAPCDAGDVLAALDGERWTGVVGAAAPAPLAGVVLLGARDRPAVPAVLELLGHLLRFPRDAGRERARFELAAAIAATVPLLRLPAHSASPGALAEQVAALVGAEAPA